MEPYMIKWRQYLNESYDTFDQILTQMGYVDDKDRYEYRFTKPLATGLLHFDIDERFSTSNKRSNQFEYTFYFVPYVHEKSRMFGLYKRRYHAPVISLEHDSIDFGEGLFKADEAGITTRLKSLLETGEQRIESLQVDDIEYEKMSSAFQPTQDIIKKI